MIRDSQVLAGRHGTISTESSADPSGAPAAPRRKNKRAALRKLVSQELGIDIQSGEHSSVGQTSFTVSILLISRHRLL
jgi:RNA exonuclease 4